MHFYLHISKIFTNFAPGFVVKTTQMNFPIYNIADSNLFFMLWRRFGQIRIS